MMWKPSALLLFTQQMVVVRAQLTDTERLGLTLFSAGINELMAGKRKHNVEGLGAEEHKLALDAAKLALDAAETNSGISESSTRAETNSEPSGSDTGADSDPDDPTVATRVQTPTPRVNEYYFLQKLRKEFVYRLESGSLAALALVRNDLLRSRRFREEVLVERVAKAFGLSERCRNIQQTVSRGRSQRMSDVIRRLTTVEESISSLKDKLWVTILRVLLCQVDSDGFNYIYTLAEAESGPTKNEKRRVGHLRQEILPLLQTYFPAERWTRSEQMFDVVTKLRDEVASQELKQQLGTVMEWVKKLKLERVFYRTGPMRRFFGRHMSADVAGVLASFSNGAGQKTLVLAGQKTHNNAGDNYKNLRIGAHNLYLGSSGDDGGSSVPFLTDNYYQTHRAISHDRSAYKTVKVVTAYWDVAGQVADQIESFLEENREEYNNHNTRFLLAGHSQGASVSVLLALMFKTRATDFPRSQIATVPSEVFTVVTAPPPPFFLGEVVTNLSEDEAASTRSLRSFLSENVTNIHNRNDSLVKAAKALLGGRCFNRRTWIGSENISFNTDTYHPKGSTYGQSEWDQDFSQVTLEKKDDRFKNDFVCNGHGVHLFFHALFQSSTSATA